ncbi:XisH family protein [Desertifilum sp. FACHB-1129]|uniref:Fatty-acid synthase n=2 Tax=Desertifilum tharense IPPAS B-1220 TaxID=1781255 RepID=A0A1E5QKK3_9CYAN|nr:MULTISPECIES: element excision factor XisH family protein [Desertifilum]MDA0211110.1 element excision factor XisH family protein [Cyanobacteria bacterium FC1]MBD2314154.1 XisH family protein [Desertifilum sp. FACHB-1129]MBD2320119.1 XisH family protein [Desertifilum sp. FACHB-866]MBD2330247.1 XisH family protein [Desertifilum sp. FACHB-868]OEJ75121.1 fatty-acid synthase [Desertifilum tharense IPPAS B-1220]
MPALDHYHNAVKNALIKAGWLITHDPLHLRWGTRDMYVDLGARRLLAAEQGEQKIAVEVKSFIGYSEIEDLKNAVGQFVLYRAILSQTEPDRKLYLAVRENTFISLFEEPVGQLLIRGENLSLITFNPTEEAIVRWIT